MNRILLVDDDQSVLDVLVMAFEEEFGSEIPDEDAEKMTTVGAVVGYLKEKGVEG